MVILSFRTPRLQCALIGSCHQARDRKLESRDKHTHWFGFPTWTNKLKALFVHRCSTRTNQSISFCAHLCREDDGEVSAAFLCRPRPPHGRLAYPHPRASTSRRLVGYPAFLTLWSLLTVRCLSFIFSYTQNIILGDIRRILLRYTRKQTCLEPLYLYTLLSFGPHRPLVFSWV